MNGRRRAALAITLASVTLVAAACGDDDKGASAPAESTTQSTMTRDPATADSKVDGSTTEESMSDEAVPLAAWQTIEITDVEGAAFTLAEYVGTPVLVETFATWCVNCRAQLGDTQQAAATLGEEAAVVALSVETDLSPTDVAEYAADNGFSAIRFAVMSPELLAALADALGTSVANPPSTPKVIIDAVGRAGELSTGPASVDDLVAAVRAAAA